MLCVLCIFILHEQLLSGEQTGFLLCQTACWALGRGWCEAATTLKGGSWFLVLHSSKIISLFKVISFALHPLGCRISLWWLVRFADGSYFSWEKCPLLGFWYVCVQKKMLSGLGIASSKVVSVSWSSFVW